MFGYASDATISGFTLEGSIITSGTNQYAACLVAVAKAGSINNISIVDSQINSTYAGAGLSYIGGVIGSYIAGTAATLSSITIDNLAISIPLGGYSGGVVGNIPLSTTVAISTVLITDLNLTGTICLGGVVGYQVGSVTISGVTINASTGITPKISGTGYVGGVVGRS
ncbi:MAG: hypothetical protein WCN92_08260, partial [Eubacteriales bacterium]